MINSFDINKLNINSVAINIIGNHPEIIKNILIFKNRLNSYIPININHNENIKYVLENQEQIILNNQNNQNEMIVLIDMNDSNYRERYFKELCFNGRCYKIDYIIQTKPTSKITPELRSNFDFVFLFYDENIDNRKLIYDRYCGMFSTFEEFDNIFSESKSLVIDNRNHYENLIDRCMYYINTIH